MYAVVGCSRCSALWILEGRAETATCPRCEKRTPRKRLRSFVETDDADHARDVRAAMLAERSGEGEAFASVGSFAETDGRAGEPVIDDESLLEAAGIDPEEAAAAAERPFRGSTDRKTLLLEVVSDLEEPSEERILSVAGERGLDRSTAEPLLEKLVRSGTLTEHRGRYRVL
ncbi:DUF5817 domain-containing protein [Natronorarus salvus]|uniref:DUF5817 domain-containing protein n=1 Tax=Natronorarus salvus TaxID=3117733 RepID=UPI002F25FAC8